MATSNEPHEAREPFDHYPRYAPPYLDRNGWRDKGKPQPGEWEHVCTSGECPEGNYFVTALDAGQVYYMAGPYPTHADALAMVDRARDLTNKHDRSGKAWFMSWGTVRSTRTDVGSLNRHKLI